MCPLYHIHFILFKYYNIFYIFLDAEQIIINQEESISKLVKDVDDLYIMMSANLDTISKQSDHYRTCNN